MSLINEALKRAQAERNRAEGIGDGHIPAPPMLEPADDDRKDKSSPLVSAIIAVAIVAATVIGWKIIESVRNSGGPSRADAAQVSPDQQTAKPMFKPAEDRVDPAYTGKSAARAVPEPFETAVTPEPVAPEPTESEANNLPDSETVGSAVVSTNSSPSEAVAEPAEPAEPKIDPVDPKSFTLNGVVTGPDGKEAIINGQFIKLGETIDRAKVTGINKYSVTLQADGTSFTIKM
ncbi:MAG: hypothetical protein ACLFVU_08885 [Phycisphaerae bacterium]